TRYPAFLCGRLPALQEAEHCKQMCGLAQRRVQVGPVVGKKSTETAVEDYPGLYLLGDSQLVQHLIDYVSRMHGGQLVLEPHPADFQDFIMDMGHTLGIIEVIVRLVPSNRHDQRSVHISDLVLVSRKQRDQCVATVVETPMALLEFGFEFFQMFNRLAV